jgi:VCBS repeat protein
VEALSVRMSRLFVTGLVGAALAAPRPASAGLIQIIKDITGGKPGTASAPPSPQPATVRVNSPRELLFTLSDEKFTGRVIIPHDVEWDLSGYGYIPLRTGVQLIGERGELGSRPLLFTDAPSLDGKEYDFFYLWGNNVRIEGIHLRGPANGNRSSSQPFVSGIRVNQRLAEQTKDQSGFGVVVADCELDQWTKSGVQVESDVRSVGRERAGLTRVERNYIHDNARDDGGHGVGVAQGSYVTIEGNVFDFNRHAVEAEGNCGGYFAHFNYVLQGGYRQDGSVGSYYNQHFDAHGSDGGYGGKAGEYFDVSFNTIRGDQTYYVTEIRPALMLRGTPDIGYNFNNNVLVHDDLGDAVSFKGVPVVRNAQGIYVPSVLVNGKFQASGNQYDTDYSTELATGDFDGDGKTDLFVANGTAWFYSRGGKRAWEFLHASNKRTQELGFADIDNDGVTDVLYQDPSGNLGCLKGGVVPLPSFTTVPVPMKELRFGDFDGDGKTDIFYTKDGQWMIWYGSARAWTPAASSSLPLSGFLFGEFDDVRGTDVAAVTSGMWAYSSGGTGSWTRLNKKLVGSFASAVAADFDGNGKTDIAVNDGRDWRYSADGRSPLTTLRDSPSGESVLAYPSLKSLLIGRFEGGPGAQVVAFERKLNLPSVQSVPGERLVIWRGLGSGNVFSLHSEQNMR